MKYGDVITLKSEYRDKDNGVLCYGTRLTVRDVQWDYVTFDKEPDVENMNYYPASWFRPVDEDELL